MRDDKLLQHLQESYDKIEEGKIKDFIKDKIKKAGQSTKDNLNKILQELYFENKEAFKVLWEMSKGNQVTEKEKKFVMQQIGDNFKMIGLGALAAAPVPGATLAVIGLVKLADKFKINLKPSAWS